MRMCCLELTKACAVCGFNAASAVDHGIPFAAGNIGISGQELRCCGPQVANFLVSEQAGFENVSNVVGGIDAYAMVDPLTPRY